MDGHCNGYFAFRCQGLASGNVFLPRNFSTSNKRAVADNETLQSYLSESEDDGGYGNVALGRSFALEIGSSIPLSDRRLGSMQNYGVDKVNVASGFVAQYTTRQNYRYPVISTPETDISNFDMSGKGNQYLENHTRVISSANSETL